MRIHCDFTGGNIIVKNIHKNVVDLECDLRDNYEDWFYWSRESWLFVRKIFL